MIDADDLELLERSLRRAVEQRSDVDRALDEVGWLDVLAIDPRTAVSLLFSLQGKANATSSALDRVLLDGLGADDPSGATVLPPLGHATPPGSLAGGRLTVAGLATAGLASREQVAVAARTDGTDVVLAMVPTSALTVRTVEGIDPGLGLVEVTAEAVAVATEPRPVPAWPDAVARTQLAVGHELVGASRAMLDLARTHALERLQFGQPIARFQAVRHRLADTLVAIETADAALEAAWLDRSPTSAAMAKALAGRAGRTAARHCQQVLAGIGFTTEHGLHRYVRRTFVLDELVGAARTLTTDLGEELLASRRLPPLLPL